MTHEVWDISRLSRLKRHVAFPRRLAQTFFGTVVISVIAAASISIYHWLAGSLRWSQEPREAWIVAAIAFLVATSSGLSMLFVSRGRRWAIVTVVLALAAIALLDSIDFATDAVSGFAYHDVPPGLRKIQSLSLQLGNDVRLVAPRLTSLLLVVLSAALFARMLAAYFPPRGALTSRERRLVFSAPPRLSLIGRNLAHFLRHSGSTDALLKTLAAAALYLAYFLAVTFATMSPFYTGTIDDDYKRLDRIVNVAQLESLWLIHAIQVLAFIVNLGVAWLLFVVSRFFLNLSNRVLVQSADGLRAVDTRQPVLYLRSFRNDQLPAKVEREAGPLALFDPVRERSTFEELIVRRCHSIGPVLAIADPKVPLPPFGAARRRASDLEWHDVVKSYMAEAVVVVVLMDFTDNLKWEIDRLSEGGHVANTWLVFPPVADRQHYSRMLAIAAEAFFAGEPEPFAAIDPALRVCAVARRADRALIVASRTATFADYDIALQRMVEERRATT